MTIQICGQLSRGEVRLSLDIEIPPGLTVVSGPNGAGKTTLLRLLAGLEALDTGHVRHHGTPLDEPATSTFVAASDRDISLVFQEHRLFDHLNVLDNVAFPLRRGGASRHDARSAARHHLEAVGMASSSDSHPRNLSVGQQQRVALARGLAANADVLLLDEPLAAIDPRGRQSLRKLLMSSLGAPTIVWVTHADFDASRADGQIVFDSNGVRHTQTHDR